jgi:cell division septation protein DedD
MTAWFDEEFDAHDPVEVHWSSSTILAIFFAASLVSAVFFGLGYSFGGAGTGNHSFTFNTAPADTSAAEPTVPLVKPNPLPASNQPSPTSISASNPNVPLATTAPAKLPSALHSVAIMPVARPVPHAAEKKSAPPPVVRHDNAPIVEKSSAHIMVQVGAIGNRRDAERLMAELRKKGFHAGIYSAKHDKFLHVQIGPFKDATQAQRERHQVMASGFHAILKSS